MSSGIKYNANHPQAVVDVVNSIEIEGARIPFDEPFTEEELNGVSSFAIMLHTYYDLKWDAEYDSETPSRLSHWVDRYGKITLFINESLNFWERFGPSSETGPMHPDSSTYGPQDWSHLWYIAFHYRWNPESHIFHGWQGTGYQVLEAYGMDEDDAFGVEAAEYNEYTEVHDAFKDGSFRVSNTALKAHQKWPYDVSNDWVWKPGGGTDIEYGGVYDWAAPTYGDEGGDDWIGERLKGIPSSTAVKVPCMADGKVGNIGWTHQEYANQLKNDRAFFTARTAKYKTAIQAYAMASELDDSIDEKLEEITDIQEQLDSGVDSDGNPLDPAARAALEAELESLRQSVSPANLAQRAEQLQKLEQLREDGEAGEFAAAWRSMEQCFLIADFVEMSKYSIARKQDYRIPGGPSMHMVHGDIGNMVSKLVFDPNYSLYYFLTPDKLSYLTPRIQLFQVLHEVYEPGTNPPTEQTMDPPVDFEIPFFHHITDFDIDHIMSGPDHGRGGAVQIKSFDWVYQGSNPASSRRDIKATLVLSVQNFSELVRKRTVSLPHPESTATNPVANINHEWTYADLAIRRSRDHQAAPNTLYSQVKVVVGWGMKDGATEMSTMGFTSDEIKAIRNSQMTMFLTLIDHAFDIKEDGTVDFKIEYRAYIEGAFTSPEANVLVTPNLVSNKKKRDEALAAIQEDLQNPEGKCRPEDMAELRRRFSQSIQKDKAEAHMALLRGLEGENPNESRLYVRTIDIVQMMNFMDNPFSAITGDDPPDANAPPSSNPAPTTPPTTDRPGSRVGGTVDNPNGGAGVYLDAIEESINFPDNINFNNSEQPDVNKMMESIYPEQNDGEINIAYFFLGDLINVALQNIHSNDDSSPKRFDRTRILLGPLEINSFTNSKVKYQVNLADIPISVNYFMEWFLRRIQAKQQVVWYLMDFIKDIIKNMVFDILNSDECFNGAIRQKAKFQNLYLVAGGAGGVDPVQAKIDAPAGSMTGNFKRLFINEVTTGNFPILSVDRSDVNVPSHDQYNYVLLYAADPQPANLTGNFEKDLSNGIYHFHIGTNKGLVKRLKFTKTDQPYMREARYFSQGYDGFSQLREPYKVDVEMYGNARIFPGMTVYIDPSGLGYSLGSPANNGDMAWTLGLGGYHMVINVQHSIARGEFSTRVNCVWVLRGSEGGETTQADGAETPARNTSNCEPLNNYGPPSGYDPNAE